MPEPRFNTKYQLCSWCLFDYKGIESYLSELAAAGWSLEKTGILFWKFVRTKPVQKKFEIVFSKDTSDFTNRLTGEQSLLYELNELYGWKKEGEWRKMLIFSNSDPDAVSLETDETVRFRSICRSMDRSFVINWLTAFAVELILSRRVYLDYLHEQTNANLGALIICVYAALFSLFMLFAYGLWQRITERRIEKGEDCMDCTWIHKIQKAWLKIFLILVAIYFIMGEAIGIIGMIKAGICLAGGLLTVGMAGRIPGSFRKLNLSTTANIALSMLCVTILLMIYIVFFSFVIRL